MKEYKTLPQHTPIIPQYKLIINIMKPIIFFTTSNLRAKSERPLTYNTFKLMEQI